MLVQPKDTPESSARFPENSHVTSGNWLALKLLTLLGTSTCSRNGEGLVGGAWPTKVGWVGWGSNLQG